jgi:hypothetical protein
MTGVVFTPVFCVDNEPIGWMSCLHDKTDIRRISDTEPTGEGRGDEVASTQ